jgi:hypothetical protein
LSTATCSETEAALRWRCSGGAHAPAAIHGGGSYADGLHAAAKFVAQAVAAHVVARANGGSGHCGHGGDRGGRGVTFTEALVAGPHHYGDEKD